MTHVPHLPVNLSAPQQHALTIAAHRLRDRLARDLATGILRDGPQALDAPLFARTATLRHPHPDYGPTHWTLTAYGHTATGAEVEDTARNWAQHILTNGAPK